MKRLKNKKSQLKVEANRAHFIHFTKFEQMKYFKYTLLTLMLIPFAAYSQKENDDVRAGNRLYKNKKYTEAEIEYRKALQKNNKSLEANYNLGNALFRQGK